jgi:hypothetical protein
MRRYIQGTPEERIAAWSIRDGQHLLWQGAMHAAKYPIFNVDRTKHYVRRWLYEHQHGALPARTVVIPQCGIDRCISLHCAKAIPHRDALIRADTPVMRKLRQTHCKHGHPLVEGNLYHNARMPNTRRCRLCALEVQRRFNAERRTHTPATQQTSTERTQP